MKNSSHFLLIVVGIVTMVLAACSGAVAAPTSNPGGGKAEPIPVAFLGTVDSIAGDQWVINGQTVTVLPDALRDGSFNVGDQIKVEGVVNADGSFTVSRVEAPNPQDSSTLPQFGDDNSNDVNSNDSNINDSNTNDDNSNISNANDVNANDDNSNGINSNDDNSNTANSNDVTNINDDNWNDDDSNDDRADNGNSDDSNSNDDSSGSGGSNDNRSDDNGNDDNGGGGNEGNGNGG